MTSHYMRMKIVRMRRALEAGRMHMESNGKAVERRKFRPNQGWYNWKRAWDILMKPLLEMLSEEKKLKDERGRFKHPRRISRLKGQVTVLLTLREQVRTLVRVESILVKNTKTIDKTNGADTLSVDRAEARGDRSEGFGI